MFKSSSKNGRRFLFFGCLISLVVGIGVGILIGHFAINSPAETPVAETPELEDRKGVFLEGVSEEIIKEADPTISKKLIDAVKSENIRTYLRDLTKKPHLAGTPADLEQAEYIRNFWESVGLDEVTITPYKVLLSYPNKTDPNFIQLLDGQGNVQLESEHKEEILRPEDFSAANLSDVVQPFNAFAAPGDEQGELVYANYGRPEDYYDLQHNYSINISGKIVIARYGSNSRGVKVRLAEEHGAIGVILYSDPADYSKAGATQVYPHDWWLPPSGVQRGTIFFGPGDPQTPGYPGIATAYRESEEESYFRMPKIPVHPIGFGDAEKIFRELSGVEAPVSWRGGLNITYRLGGSFINSTWKIRIKNANIRTERITYNTIGVVRGQIEPDRYVLLGNHRDAWVFGGVDPSSGTAVMMELSRVVGDMLKTKTWRPRRSMMFCSWGAEEYGLFGSTEWVEHYTKTLGARAVTYLNVDLAVRGNDSLGMQASPVLNTMAFEAMRKVQNPNPNEVAANRTTVYDTYDHLFHPPGYPTPIILLPGSGSDFNAFRNRLGIPIANFVYTYNVLTAGLSSYPLYHTMYDTFYQLDEIIDRGFKHHQAIGRVWIEMARDFADSLILPLSLADFDSVIQQNTNLFLQFHGAFLNDHGVDTELLEIAIGNLSLALHNFEQSISSVNKNDPLAVRRVNDQLMQITRAFLDPQGLPERHLTQYVLTAESLIDNYSAAFFPGLADLLFELENSPNSAELWRKLKKHYSAILFSLQSAATTLKDVTKFMVDHL